MSYVLTAHLKWGVYFQKYPFQLLNHFFMCWKHRNKPIQKLIFEISHAVIFFLFSEVFDTHNHIYIIMYFRNHSVGVKHIALDSNSDENGKQYIYLHHSYLG